MMRAWQAAWRKHWRILLPAVAVVFAVLFIFIARFFAPAITESSLKPYQPELPAESVPVTNTKGDRIILYEFTVEYAWWQLPSVVVRTNGCLYGLVSEGKPGDLAHAVGNQPCAKARILSVNLGKVLNPGTQKVMLLVA